MSAAAGKFCGEDVKTRTASTASTASLDACGESRQKDKDLSNAKDTQSCGVKDLIGAQEDSKGSEHGTDANSGDESSYEAAKHAMLNATGSWKRKSKCQSDTDRTQKKAKSR